MRPERDVRGRLEVLIPPLIWQFLKYGLIGGLATLLHVLIFTSLNETVLPADLTENPSERGWNFFFANAVAFVIANFLGYLANRQWVFRPGRHDRWAEASLYYLISIIAFFIGTPFGAFLVSAYALNEYAVFLVVVCVSVITNFLGRKYLVFSG